MTPPPYAWAAWAYRAAMAVISSWAMAMLGWVTWHLMQARHWPQAAWPQLLRLLGWIILGLLALLIVQQLGLVARNLVRQLRIHGPAGTSIDVTGHDAGRDTGHEG
jgi:hypothetical protein